MEEIRNIFTKKLNFVGSTGKRSVYITLIKGEKNCLVDTGTADNFDNIISFCQENGVSITDLDVIINTHCHPDHIGSNYLFKKANPNIIFYAHSLAVPFIENIEKQYNERPIPGFFNLISNSNPVDIILDDGDIIDIGIKLKVIHTPGHSKGSISIFIPEKSVLITGDTIPEKKGLPIYEDINELKQSFMKLKETEANYAISSFDGYCNNIVDVVNSNGEKLIHNVDQLVKKYLTQYKIDNLDKIDDHRLEDIAIFVLNNVKINIKPSRNIKKSIENHIINSVTN